ncbi:pentatricopeptide repeat-containing protein At4g21300 isoform X2 [Tripterygium wilfordii]|nr:pentatricopeptide repeat-containing protein At4g21300 isoform X2 [Tripterygium wilfordii]
MGKLVHETIVSMNFDVDAFAGSSLIKLYAENGCLDDAQLLFDKIPVKDCVLWNVMLHSYVKCGKGNDAMKVFNDMRNNGTRPNSVAFACILSLCSSEEMIGFGAQLHGLVVIFGLEFASQVANTLMAMYSKCGHCFDARKLFDMMNHRDLVTWNAMISGYVQNKLTKEASLLFREMISAGVKPDSFTFSSFLPAVTESMCPNQGKEIHGYIVRNGVVTDMFLKCALIDIYFKGGEVKVACRIFNKSTKVDIGMCTAMISGYMLHGMNINALEVFRWVVQAKIRVNTLTLVSILPACVGLVAVKLGKELHGNILKNGFQTRCHVESAIMDMYAKCGRLDLAHRVFIRISERDTISWNSMITNYCQNGKPVEAMDLFRQMGIVGMRYDCVSISQALSACANLPALHYGKEIHGFMVKNAFNSNLFAESALIDMYAKCGHLNLAHRVFNTMTLKNEVSWNSIIGAYGFHGHLKECLSLYNEMLENGIRPDHVTFLGIISACGHAGLVDDGIHYFRCMTEEYGIQARMEHYACMVDLYGRAGRLTEAFETIKSMPFLPDTGVWGTLLGACRVHGNVEFAELASGHLFALDPQNSGYYILLSNILADTGQWGRVLKIRSMMKERGVQKVPGYSWIEVNNITHMFVSADGSHPHSAQVYSMLESLLLELRREGYGPQPLVAYPQNSVI